MADDFVPDEVLQLESLGGYGPLTIELLEDEDGSFVVVETETVQYGHAATRDAALLDLADTLAEYHEHLRQHGPDRLGLELNRHLRFLETHRIDGARRSRSVAV